jgi:hypothetical protein
METESGHFRIWGREVDATGSELLGFDTFGFYCQRVYTHCGGTGPLPTGAGFTAEGPYE